jgi:peptide/nickel transport system substrate-binding protein
MEQMTWPGQMEVGISGERNMTVMGGSGFFASDALAGFFHSSNAESGFNWSKIKDPKLDALLDEASQTTDPEQRKELYGQAQEFIMEQALILPVYDYTVLSGLDANVAGLHWSSIGLVPLLNDIYIEQ